MKPKDPFEKLSEEERKEKIRKVKDLHLERSDFVAMFLAAMRVFLPPILLILFLLWFALYILF